MAYQIQFMEARCTGCLACHMACISTHFDYQEEAESFRAFKRVVNEQDGFQKNCCPGCTHCGACIKVCPAKAIFKDDETGFVLYDKEKCTGCRLCESKCPAGVIRFDKKGKMEKCDGCVELIRIGKEPACVRNCYAGAIILEER